METAAPPSRFLRGRAGRSLLLGVILVALVPRGAVLDLMEFKGDEVMMHLLALRHAGGEFMLHGMLSSVGVLNPPLGVYLFSLPAALSRDPLVMAWMVVLFNLAAVAIAYRIAEEFFSRRCAVWAGILFALSPWAVIFSRKIWAQDMLPFFTCLALYGALAFARKGRRWGIVLFAFGVVCATLIHFSGFALWPIGVVLLAWDVNRFLKRRKAEGARVTLGAAVKSPWVQAALVAVLLFGPWLRWEHKDEYRGLRRLLQVTSSSKKHTSTRLARAGLHVAFLATHGEFDYLLGKSRAHFRPWGIPGVPEGVTVLLVMAVAWAIHNLRRRPDGAICILWLLSPVIAVSTQHTMIHYLVITYPAQFVLIGAMLDDVARSFEERLAPRWRCAPGILASCLVGLIVFSNSIFYASFMRFVRDHGGTHGDYGVAYRYKLQIARFVRKSSGGRPYQLQDISVASPSPETFAYLVSLEKTPTPSETREKLYVVMSEDFPVSLRVDRRKLELVNIFRFSGIRLAMFEKVSSPAQERR